MRVSKLLVPATVGALLIAATAGPLSASAFPSPPNALPAGESLFATSCVEIAATPIQLVGVDAGAVTTPVGSGTDLGGNFSCGLAGAYNATNGQTYYVVLGDTPSLATVNLSTGVSSIVGALTNAVGGASVRVFGLAINAAGQAFAADFVSGDPSLGHLYSVDLTTGVLTLIGTDLGTHRFEALAFSPDGTLYAYDTDTFAPSELFEIDTTFATATPVDGTSFRGTGRVMAIQFDSTGLEWLVAYDAETTSSNLYSVDIESDSTTSQGTLSSSLAPYFFASLILAPTPVAPVVDDASLARTGMNPSSTSSVLALAGGLVFVGFAGLLLIRRRTGSRRS
jgi:hypothetical protein